MPAIPAVTNGFCVNTSNTLTNPVKALVAVTITSLAVLTDMEYKAKEAKEKKNEIDWSDQQILPLVKKYDDHSNGFMVTYKKVYTRMEENSRIGWKNLVTRYINECGGKPTKKDLINTRKSLQKKFTKAIEELMEE